MADKPPRDEKPTANQKVDDKGKDLAHKLIFFAAGFIVGLLLYCVIFGCGCTEQGTVCGDDSSNIAWKTTNGETIVINEGPSGTSVKDGSGKELDCTVDCKPKKDGGDSDKDGGKQPDDGSKTWDDNQTNLPDYVPTKIKATCGEQVNVVTVTIDNQGTATPSYMYETLEIDPWVGLNMSAVAVTGAKQLQQYCPGYPGPGTSCTFDVAMPYGMGIGPKVKVTADREKEVTESNENNNILEKPNSCEPKGDPDDGVACSEYPMCEGLCVTESMELGVCEVEGVTGKCMCLSDGDGGETEGNLPDLTVVSITPLCEQQTASEITIKNLGPGDMPNDLAQVNFTFIGNGKIIGHSPGNMGIFSSSCTGGSYLDSGVECRFTLGYLYGGTDTIRVCLDVLDNIMETDEGNNCLEVPWPCGGEPEGGDEPEGCQGIYEALDFCGDLCEVDGHPGTCEITGPDECSCIVEEGEPEPGPEPGPEPEGCEAVYAEYGLCQGECEVEGMPGVCEIMGPDECACVVPEGGPEPEPGPELTECQQSQVDNGYCQAMCTINGQQGYCVPDGEDCVCEASESDPETCVPDCSGKDCGGDGCGGTCGECDVRYTCCDWTCVNTDSDNDNCGWCGGECAGECQMGQCILD